MTQSVADLIASWNRAAAREVEILGVKFRIRGMSTADRIAFVAAVRGAKGDPETLERDWSDAQIVARGLCDDNGELLGASPADLASMDSGLLSRLASAILKASGIGQDEAEEAEKN